MAFQDITGARLGQVEMTTDYIAMYTCPPNTRTYIKDMSICNTTAGALTFYVSLVPDQATVGAANAIYYNTTIAAEDIIHWTGAQIMNAGDTIQVKGSASGVTITVTGGEAI
jgi:hypothetical protein